MPFCKKSEDDLINQAINEEITREKKLLKNKVKLLLLGAGESGKTTFLKQLRIIHSTGFQDKDKKSYTQVVFANIIQNITALIEAAQTLKDAVPIDVENQEIAQNLVALNTGTDFPNFADVAKDIKRMWTDPGIRHCFSRSAEFQLNDNAEYFFNDIDRVAEPGYVPTEADLLRVRVKTSGLTEVELKIGENRWSIVDVGGQRSERRKWIHCFEGVTAIIFFVSLSEYDQKLNEDHMTNRMSEAMKLFRDISNYPRFADEDTAIILFLNKKDLFQKKIKEVPLNVFFKDYDGPNEYGKATAYIRKQFLKMAPPSKQIHVYKTCATDTDNIRLVFRTVKEHIIAANMTTVGIYVTPTTPTRTRTTTQPQQQGKQLKSSQKNNASSSHSLAEDEDE